MDNGRSFMELNDLFSMLQFLRRGSDWIIRKNFSKKSRIFRASSLTVFISFDTAKCLMVKSMLSY